MLEDTATVGRKAPEESKTTSLFVPGFKSSKYLLPDPVPEPEVETEKAV